ncbi:hypothetical protein RUM43_007504 [Polyplax serrata]|uniref:Uncharacterized protein n=1 Tax=Polyplax serrata TaxID=468196 RepID=A0AAN8P205_POLSC
MRTAAGESKWKSSHDVMMMMMMIKARKNAAEWKEDFQSGDATTQVKTCANNGEQKVFALSSSADDLPKRKSSTPQRAVEATERTKRSQQEMTVEKTDRVFVSNCEGVSVSRQQQK